MPHSKKIATSIVVEFLGSLGEGQREVVSYETLRRLRNAIRDSIDEAASCERHACIRAAEASLPGKMVAAAIRSARDAEMAEIWELRGSSSC